MHSYTCSSSLIYFISLHSMKNMADPVADLTLAFSQGAVDYIQMFSHLYTCTVLSISKTYGLSKKLMVR